FDFYGLFIQHVDVSRWVGRKKGRIVSLMADALPRSIVASRTAGGDAMTIWLSPADAQPVDELLVPVLVGRLDVIEQPAPLAHELEQPAPRMVILGMRLEVIGEIGDALGQDCDLNFWRTGIAGFGRILLDKLLLALSANRHRIDPCCSRGLSGPSRDVVQHGRFTCAGELSMAPMQSLQYRDYLL